MKFFITGGAGFIGSNLCDHLLSKGHEVVCFDDLSTGLEFFLQDALKNDRFQFIKGDIQQYSEIQKALKETKPEWVVHLAANADVRHGFEHPRKDLDINTIGTWNVLEASRKADVKKFIFSSTGSVYGEQDVFPITEEAPFPDQTSLYGASKLAGEGLISAYCNGYGMTGVVFRFVSILGQRYTHGHVYDFVKKLKADPKNLEILGDGNQDKSYLHIKDLMNGLWLVIGSVEKNVITNQFNVFNIGHESSLVVKDSATLIANRMGLSPTFNFTGGVRGWIGDSPKIQLDASKLKQLGWSIDHSIGEGVEDTVDYLLEHPNLLQ